MQDQLTVELLKRIFGNLGAVPGEKFGTAGITEQIFVLKDKYVKLLGDNGDVKYSIPVWSAQLNESPFFKVLLTNLNTFEAPEFFLVLSSSDDLVIGFAFDWKEFGEILICRESSWTVASVLHRLNIAVAFETIAQNGFLWQANSEFSDNLFNSLLELIERE